MIVDIDQGQGKPRQTYIGEIERGFDVYEILTFGLLLLLYDTLQASRSALLSRHPASCSETPALGPR